MSSSWPGRFRTLRLLAVSGDITHSHADIRLVQPLRAAARHAGWSLQLKSFDACRDADWLGADVVVMQRPAGAEPLWRQAWLRRHGIPMVYEIDDLITEPAAHLEFAALLREQASGVRAMLGQASAIACSTPRLAQRLVGLGPPVFVVPNCGPAAVPAQARHDDGQATILVAASDLQEVAALAEALARLGGRPDAPAVVAIGPVARSLQAHGVAAHCLPVMGREEFLRTIAALPNPVGAIPLDDSPFSNCKSAIKFFDYSALGIPCVCSNVPPYADVVEHGRTGLLCENDPAAWQAALERLCASAALRREFSTAAHKDVACRHGLQQTVAAWIALIERVRAGAPGWRQPDARLRHLLARLELPVKQCLARARQFNRKRKALRRVQRPR